MGKRASTSSLAASTRKKPAACQQAEKCASIASAVKEVKALGLEDFPGSLVDMLVSMASSSIGVYKDARHAHQEKVIEMIGKALKANGAAKEAKVGEFKAKIDGAEKDKAARAANKDSAEAASNALKDTLATKKGDYEAAKTAKAAAASALKDAKKTQSTGDATLEAVVAEKTKLEEGLNSLEACPLNKKGVLTLTSISKEYKVDTSLIEAMHTALTKSAETRGAFDNVIMTQLKDALTGFVAQKTQEVQAGQPDKDARAAAVSAAKDALDAAEAHEKGCKDAVADAEKAVDDGKAAGRAAAKACSNWLPDLKETMDSYDDAKAGLKSFQEGPLAAYAELVDMETPAPEPEPMEDVAEDAAAAEAPAAEATAEGAATV